jgi:hypothetical protein
MVAHPVHRELRWHSCKLLALPALNILRWGQRTQQPSML